MKAKRGDTTGVLGEYLMDQALANKMLADALSKTDSFRDAWSLDEEHWEPVQTALELGADWRPKAKDIIRGALRIATLRDLKALSGLGLRLEAAEPRELGEAAARLGYAPWLNIALDRLAERGESLSEEASEGSLRQAAQSGEAAVFAAFDSRDLVSQRTLRDLAAQCARGGRWKMCAQLLRRAEAPTPEEAEAESAAEPRMNRWTHDPQTWPQTWAFCVSVAAGAASEKGVKALLRAWRETPNAPWDAGREADQELWLGAQDPLSSAIHSRNKKSGERIAAMLQAAGLRWSNSEALARAVRDRNLQRAEAIIRLGVRPEEHEGALALAAAQSGFMGAMRWVAERGLDFGAPSRGKWDDGLSALEYLSRAPWDWDLEFSQEMLGFAQAAHDALAVRASVGLDGQRAPTLAKPAAGKGRRL